MNLKNMKVRTKLSLLIGVAVLGLVVFGLVAYSTLNTVEVNGAMYKRITTYDLMYSDATPPAIYLEAPRLDTYLMLQAKDRSELEMRISDIKQADKIFEDSVKKYEQQLPDGKIKDQLVNKLYPTGREYLDLVETQFTPIMLNGDTKKAAEYLITDVRQKLLIHK